MYLSAAEARERLGVSRETFRKLIKNGLITAHKISDGTTSPYQISEDELDAYVERQRAKAVAS